MKSIFVPATAKIHTPEWFAARRKAIGASEVSACMALNPYIPAAKLFYTKLGLMEEENINNNFIFWGNKLEDLVAQAWELHTGHENSYLETKEPVRKAEVINGHYTTDEFPFIAATPDRLFTGFKIKTLEDGSIQHIESDKKYPLEIKTLSSFSLAQWTSGIPVYFLAQIHAQMLCVDADYAELAMLVDGRELKVYHIDRSNQLIELIVAKCKEFWDRVEQAKDFLEQGDMAGVQSLEPDPEGTQAYEQFIKEKFKTQPKSRIATEEENLLMKNYLRAHELEKQAADSKQDLKNKLLRSAEDYEQITSFEAELINRPANEERKRSFFSIKSLIK